MINLFLVSLLSYLVGSFPSSIVASKWLKGIDIRDYGSGNAGGTNTFRVLGWKAGLFVTLTDIGKGALATGMISQWQFAAWPAPPLSPIQLQILCGLLSVIGHVWTVFASFRGGKGVATAGGMLLTLSPWTFLMIILIFALVFFIFRYVSLASVLAIGSLPVFLKMLSLWKIQEVPSEMYGPCILLSLLVVFTHRENIKRLLQGKEKKFHGQDHDSKPTVKELSK